MSARRKPWAKNRVPSRGKWSWRTRRHTVAFCWIFTFLTHFLSISSHFSFGISW